MSLISFKFTLWVYALFACFFHLRSDSENELTGINKKIIFHKVSAEVLIYVDSIIHAIFSHDICLIFFPNSDQDGCNLLLGELGDSIKTYRVAYIVYPLQSQNALLQAGSDKPYGHLGTCCICSNLVSSQEILICLLLKFCSIINV